jgi:hypothetical protein
MDLNSRPYSSLSPASPLSPASTTESVELYRLLEERDKILELQNKELKQRREENDHLWGENHRLWGIIGNQAAQIAEMRYIIAAGGGSGNYQQQALPYGWAAPSSSSDGSRHQLNPETSSQVVPLSLGL